MMLKHRARFGVEQGERTGEHVVLELGILWLAERTPEGEVTPECTRRLGPLDDRQGRGQRDGGDAGCFEDVGEHTHGARAERSNGGEEHDVDAVGLQGRCRGRARILSLIHI